jgi:hypothetical protein
MRCRPGIAAGFGLYKFTNKKPFRCRAAAYQATEAHQLLVRARCGIRSSPDVSMVAYVWEDAGVESIWMREVPPQPTYRLFLR